MSALILDGRKAREALTPALIEKIKSFSRPPTLAIIQAGERPDSDSYIKAKKSFAKKIGVQEKHIRTKESITQNELAGIIKDCNDNKSITGIIVQLPLPEHLDRGAMMETIDPKKDADGLTSFNVKLWSDAKNGARDQDYILPATARGVKELLDYYGIGLRGKKVCVVGRSALVGKPIAAMCANEGAVVSVCHSKTPDLASETRKADILIVAVGKPRLIEKDHVKSGQVVIDIGINTVLGEKLEDEVASKRLVGDVDFNAVKDVVGAISPVPGGVGPMTVLALFENVADLGR